MKTKIPKDFAVDDSDREYALKKGWPLHIPDVFLIDFIEYHETAETKHVNWRAAFKRHMRMNSPAGGYYRPWSWERKLNDAKAMESARYPRVAPVPYYDESLRRTPMPTAVRDLVEKMRVKL